MSKLFLKFKYKLARLFEQFPNLNFLILNNLRFIKFLLPHDKDYLGIKLICKNRLDYQIIDIGGNIGSSILSFRSLGFENEILVFEPNDLLVKKYLCKIKSRDPHIKIFNYGLGDEDNSKILYIPYFNNLSLHTYSSFDKSFLLKGLKKSLPDLKIRIEEKIISIKKFDNLKFIKKPHLIKIDAEGFEVQIIHGMMMTIKKYMPILLVEYKKEQIKEIIKILPHYFAYAYDLGSNSFKLFYPEKFNNIRNIYFIPKEFKW